MRLTADRQIMPKSEVFVINKNDDTIRYDFIIIIAPCRLRGCKNGPAPFPGRMSYKATKPGLVSVLYLSMFFYCVGVY